MRGKVLECFSSYLSGRSQRVLFDGIKSDSFDVRFGVPQGSCLGPLLFVIYISKLFEIVQAHLPDAHCFADDTQLYLSFTPNNSNHQMDAVSAMEGCICDLRKWMYQDKLKINDNRTEFFIIGSKQQLLKINPDLVRFLLALLTSSLFLKCVIWALGSTQIFLCQLIFLSRVVQHFTGFIISSASVDSLEKKSWKWSCMLFLQVELTTAMDCFMDYQIVKLLNYRECKMLRQGY